MGREVGDSWNYNSSHWGGDRGKSERQRVAKKGVEKKSLGGEKRGYTSNSSVDKKKKTMKKNYGEKRRKERGGLGLSCGKIMGVEENTDFTRTCQ